MRKIVFIAVLFLSTLAQAQYTGFNMVQLSRWDNDSLTHLGTQQFSNCWGWADSATGREYAIVGSVDSTYFIDVTVPTKPVVCDVRAGASARSVWREYKTYKNYCYAVADAGIATLQIFDLSYLPDSVHKVYDTNDVIMRSHTIWVDHDRLYCNSVITNTFQSKAVEVLSLADPEKPVRLGTLVPPIFDNVPAFVKCHDAYVRNDTMYCSGENAGLFIYNYANPVSPQLMATISDYPEKGYNHSSYVSDDGKILVFTDENANFGIKAYDISDIHDMEMVSLFRSHAPATAHNPYFIGRRLFMSYYHDGVYVFDMEDASNPKVIGWYDTYPANGTTYSGFEGCWGVYPFLPSGNILALDMTNGLFVLALDASAGVADVNGVKDLLIYPNPSTGKFSVAFDAVGSETLTLEIFDLTGRNLVRKEVVTVDGRNEVQAEMEQNLPNGIYMVQLKGTNTHICRKLVKR